MNFCGVICEFNPFHNGHQYLINEAKKVTNENIVCLMSGDFVQRGDPAIQEKYIRAKNAVNFGANAVLELPTIYAASNAENFAFGAVKILTALNVNHLAFGIENTSLDVLEKIAQIKLNNSIEFQNCFKNEIENGINYNTALKRAIASQVNDENTLEILSKPNNILAIEYLTAIKKLNSKIKPIAINRIDNGYNSNLSQNQFLSASGIREKLKNGEDVSNFVPTKTIETPFTKTNQNNFENITIFTLRNSTAKELNSCYDYTEGIEYRIKSNADSCTNFAELISSTKSPRYREPRVKKLLLYPMLKITKQLESLAQTTKPFAKVLAIKKSNKILLSNYNKKEINLIVTNKDYENLSVKQKKLVQIDINASNLYCTITNKQNNNDKKTGVLFL